jgi:hypothetical protein
VKKKLLLLSLILLLGLGLSACNRPSSSTTCTPDDLVAPTLTSPDHFAVYGAYATTDSLPPEFFQWEFPSDCTPEFFTLKFSPSPHFGTMRTGMTEGELSWPPADPSLAELPLEPATMYYWNVRAWTDGVAGPESAPQSFFTEPFCGRLEGDEDALSAPELISPEPNEIIDELHTELQFSMSESECLPTGYFVRLGTDPSFSSLSSLVRLSYPGTSLISSELEDCTTYYWRVVPFITNYIFGDFPGPYSETRAFNTRRSEACLRSLVTAEMPIGDLGYAHCETEDLVPPELGYPGNYTWPTAFYSGRRDTTPVGFLRWTNPSFCIPDGYEVTLSTDRLFRTNLRTGRTAGEAYWPVEGPYVEPGLEPGSQYFWKVQTVVEGVEGPESDVFRFFTGPDCYRTLSPPQQVSPPDGAIIHDRSFYLEYISQY